VGQTVLYPALHKLEQNGWIKAEWAASENNRRAKYYTLTRAGRSIGAGSGTVGTFVCHYFASSADGLERRLA